MESCLLCLEINKDILDGIRANSIQWQELDVVNVIEKHFWSMDTFDPSSWICFSCWREVDNFHKFFKRIEESHANFGRIRDKDLLLSTQYEVEVKKTKYNASNNDKDTTYCVLEPEILIHQTQYRSLAEPEIIETPTATLGLIIANESETNEPIDIDDIPLKQVRQRLKLQGKITSRDPLKKSTKSRRRKTYETNYFKDEKSGGDAKVKKELIASNDNKPSGIGNTDDKYQTDAETKESKKCKAFIKQRVSRKENDIFIAEHFKQIFCDICQLPFKDFPSLQKHFSKIHKQRCYVVCCKRKFSDRTRLVDHLLCHLNPDHFKCKECGKSMSDRSSFDSHMLRVHRTNEVVKQHCCDVCGKSFAKASVLRIHKLTHLSEEEKKFTCTNCGKKYGSSYLLNLHNQSVHLKRFAKICYICGKAINSSAEFQIHMNKHEGVLLHVINCDICGLRLTSERGLKLHKESQHPVGGKQEHHCPICPKISPTRKALRKHINTMHEKGCDHKCSMCEKAFKRSETLREHMASHTGTPLYVCPWCPKTFNSNSNMHTHRKNKHPKEYLELKLQRYNKSLLP